MGQFVIEYIDTPPRSPSSSIYRSNTAQRCLVEADFGHIDFINIFAYRLDHSKEPLLNSSYLEEEDLSPSIPLSTSNLRLHSASPASPLVHEPAASLTVPPAGTRPRSTQSKPDQLFIHPAESNLVRAEAFAIQHGLAVGHSDLVDTSSFTYPKTPTSSQDQAAAGRGWGGGKGRETARELLGGSTDSAFHIGDEEE